MSVPPKPVQSEFPVIDTDPHFNRVVRYARPSDWTMAGATAAAGPAIAYMWEKYSPSNASRHSLASTMRLTGAIGLTAGFLRLYVQSSMRFWGWSENQREQDMDMREMVNKVKRGEPLYGKSILTEYMQGVSARNSRYSQVFLHVVPWFNIVNHNEHGVDTAKYYKQAEAELAAEGKTLN
ncbi:hypothetical protein BJ508DRAFT_321054 [Ascobolus immersus RN42]|uniref:NADH-ubiquinone oxidoreductase 21 kDa subunit n=1 Tax=Ascobolus immersus RN42 TaxID=1160509 RepID=A0A3N4IM13_ASCIM|nr:hypothetical protein BJ508DRAFT_321054 [Ascobolus immersus RN42]